MTVFLFVAVLMIAAALFFILPPFLRKEQGSALHAQRDALNLEVLRDQLRELDRDRAEGIIDGAGYDSSRRELEQRVAEDVKPGVKLVDATRGKPWMAIVLGLLLPLLALGLYLGLGNPAALDPQKAMANAAPQNITPEQVNAMVDKLARHLKEKPDDVEGWGMIARSYNALGRFSEASDAYAHLVKLIPPNAEVLSDYADALGMANNRSLQGEPEKVINQALAIDPRSIKALALSGGASFERHDYAVAVAQWKKILAMVPADSDIGRSVSSSIKEAQALGGLPSSAPSTKADASQAQGKTSADKPGSAVGSNKGTEAAQVSGTVELDPALRQQVSDNDTVFIFARAVDGPRFPLAVLRKQVKDLPLSFTLDDSMSMMPSAKLSSFSSVVVGARISKSGSATPQPGDLEGMTEPVHTGAKALKIRINVQRK